MTQEIVSRRKYPSYRVTILVNLIMVEWFFGSDGKQ